MILLLISLLVFVLRLESFRTIVASVVCVVNALLLLLLILLLYWGSNVAAGAAACVAGATGAVAALLRCCFVRACFLFPHHIAATKNASTCHAHCNSKR